MRFEALAHENDELRGLKAALPPVAERWLVAEIVNVELNGLRQRVLINRGARNGVFKAQAVMDNGFSVRRHTSVPGAPRSFSSPTPSMRSRYRSSAPACARSR